VQYYLVYSFLECDRLQLDFGAEVSSALEMEVSVQLATLILPVRLQNVFHIAQCKEI